VIGSKYKFKFRSAKFQVLNHFIFIYIKSLNNIITVTNFDIKTFVYMLKVRSSLLFYLVKGVFVSYYNRQHFIF